MSKKVNWFIKLPNDATIELANVLVDKNTGKFTTYAGFQDSNILVIYGEEHRIKITNVEPSKVNELVIEGWAVYSFEFLDIDVDIVNLYEKYIRAINTHPVNLLKYLKEITEHLIDNHLAKLKIKQQETDN